MDETYLEVDVRSRSVGKINLISVAEQVCETAPTALQTNSPTISSQPTATPPNGGGKSDVSYGMIMMTAFTSIYFIAGLLVS